MQLMARWLCDHWRLLAFRNQSVKKKKKRGWSDSSSGVMQLFMMLVQSAWRRGNVPGFSTEADDRDLGW